MTATDNETRAAEEERDNAIRATGTDPKTGFATDGEWPINGRLRAEAMARAGVKSDPDKLIDDDLIADTAERLAREDKAAADEEAKAKAATPSTRWTEAKLREEAARRNVAITDDMDKAAMVAAIEAAPAVAQ